MTLWQALRTATLGDAIGTIFVFAILAVGTFWEVALTAPVVGQ